MSHPLLKKDSFHRRIWDPVFYDGAFLEKAKSSITDTLYGPKCVSDFQIFTGYWNFYKIHCHESSVKLYSIFYFEYGTTHLFRRCCGLPRHWNSPLTIIPSLVHSFSHSSMLNKISKTRKNMNYGVLGIFSWNCKRYIYKTLFEISIC